MAISKIKSYAKINISLRVLGKLNSKLHKIETLISFVDLYDEISLSEIKKNKHKVIFYGKFSNKIPLKNTITQLLNILDESNFLKKKKYLIKVNKKIPTKSGMGGGSMNASSILKYFIKKNRLNLKSKKILEISNRLGSDVILGMEKKNTLLKGNGKIIRYNNKIGLYVVILKPRFGCSTEKIYKDIKDFSKPTIDKKNKSIFCISNLTKLKNDLESVAFKKYPVLLNIKKNMLNLPKVKFVRMTGSGSSILGYFNSKKASLNGVKILKKKYKNYWCILSKTI